MSPKKQSLKERQTAEFRKLLTELYATGDIDGLLVVRACFDVIGSLPRKDRRFPPAFSSALLSRVAAIAPTAMKRAAKLALGGGIKKETPAWEKAVLS